MTSSRPQTVFSGGDSPYLVIMAAFRSALLEGREPHAWHTKFDDDVDLEALLPDDAEIVRSVTDDDDTVLFARVPATASSPRPSASGRSG